MNVGAEPGIVGEVEAIVIGILKDHDPVGIPAPVIAETVVIGRDVEVVSAKPEALPIPSRKTEVVSAAKAAVEAAVLPRALDAIVRIASASVMSDPAVIRVDVRSGRVPVVVAIVAIFVVILATPFWTGTVFRDTLATIIMTIMITAVVFLMPVLSKSGKGDHHHCRKNR